MKTKCTNPLIGLLLTFISGVSFGQSNEIRIKFIGNCGLYMTDGNLNIYSDFPYKSGAYKYMEFDESELENVKENATFIFTHKHADHYSKTNVKKVLKSKNGRKFDPGNSGKLASLSREYPEFAIEAFKTKHKFSFRHYSYLITWHGKRIFLSGDTESAETIGKVGKLDWAFVPYWLIRDAKEKSITIDAKMKGLYHLYPNQQFKNEIPADVRVLEKQGEVITIPY